MIAAFGLGGWEIILLLAGVFWIHALIDCIRNKALSNGEKVVWVLVMVFTSVLGALIYLVAGRKQASAN